jgi:hypothetical protein
MELRLERTEHSEDSTIGKLYVNEEFECYTLEDLERPIKIKGKTAISVGRYEIIIDDSQRFGRQLPILLNVPDFEGVRIHSGNTAADTEGCILVGVIKNESSIGESKVAFEQLFNKLKPASETEKIFIEIVSMV